MVERDVKVRSFKTDNAITQTVRDGRPEVLVINRAMRDLMRPDVFPWHLSISIQVLAGDANGMPTEKELGPVNETSDAVTAFVLTNQTESGAPNILFLGQSTWNGKRELLFRVHNPDLALALLTDKTWEKWKREWEFQLVQDPEWRLGRPILSLLANEPRN
jgi:hypothetical protein